MTTTSTRVPISRSTRCGARYFLRWCAAEGKPQTQEELDRRSDEFIALMKRCSAKAYKIISRLDSAAPHLSVVKDDDAPD